LVEQNQSKPVEAVAEHVLQAAQDWTASQLDDMTILVARYVGQ
jgi:hypothetical protein